MTTRGFAQLQARLRKLSAVKQGTVSSITQHCFQCFTPSSCTWPMLCVYVRFCRSRSSSTIRSQEGYLRIKVAAVKFSWWQFPTQIVTMLHITHQILRTSPPGTKVKQIEALSITFSIVISPSSCTRARCWSLYYTFSQEDIEM